MISKAILDKDRKKDLIFSFIVSEGPVISKEVHSFAKKHMTERNVYSVLKKLVEDGVIIKEPNLRFMTTSIYSAAKISHETEEETIIQEEV